METFHGTTILSVRRDGAVALGGDGQVTLGSVVVKATARKVRRLHNDRVLAGFAGATADAFTLFERFEAKLEKHQGQLARAAVELAKDWRSDRILRRLEAMLAVADRSASLIITGTGDVLEPEHGIVAIGSGGPYAQAAARALLEHTALSAAGHRQTESDHRRRSLHLHQPESRDRVARPRTMMPGDTDSDVLIAGAGLTGLAAARALVQAGLSVALADRANTAVPDAPPGDDDWDARVYAISPGSAAFLRALGAWQMLPPDRIAPVESMRIEGDAGALLNFSAYALGERALAWIVEERALRDALLPIVRASGIEIHAPVGVRVADLLARRGRAALRQRRFGGGAPHRRRRRGPLVGARGGRDHGRGAAVCADRGSRQFRLRARAPRSGLPVVSRRRRNPRVAAASRTPGVDRLVRAGATRAGAPRTRAGSARRARREPRADTRWAHLRRSRAARDFRCRASRCRRRSPIAWRW